MRPSDNEATSMREQGDGRPHAQIHTCREVGAGQTYEVPPWMFVVYDTGNSSGVAFRGWRKKNLVAGIRRSGSLVAVSFQHERVMIYRKGDHWIQLDNYHNRLGGLHSERLCEISMQHG